MPVSEPLSDHLSAATDLQRRMLAAGDIAGDPTLEVIRVDFTVPVTIDPVRLHLAWLTASARHEVFRSGVRSRRLVQPPGLTVLAEDQPLTDVHLRIDVDVSPYRLLWRPQGDGFGLWSWILHHAVGDARTVEVVTVDAFARYRGTPQPDPPATTYTGATSALPVPDPRENAEFWDRARGGHTPAAAPPGARGQLVSSGWRHTGLSATTDHPRATARMSTRLLAAAALVAADLTGGPGVVIGNVYSQRPALPEALRDTAGPLINVVPLCIDIDRRSTVQEFLDLVRRVDLAARPHAAAPPPSDAPADWVLTVNYLADDWRGRVRRAARAALGSETGGPDIHRRSALPMVLDAEGTTEPSCRLDTWSGLYSVGRTEDISRRFAELLTALDGPADTVVADLGTPSVTRGPRQPIAAGTAHDAVRDTARRSPHAPALWFEGAQMSYSELDARSDRMAALLQGRGISPGDRVAICLPRGTGAPVAVLATLKTGAAYVPIEPDLPQHRVNFILADTGAALVITTGVLAHRAGQLPQLDIDAVGSDAALPRLEGGRSGAGPYTVAYVIYTSGSTGVPKGVEVTHRSLVNLMHAQREAFDVRADDRVLHFASLGFDASVSEIFVTWRAGGCLVVASADGRIGAGLQRTLRDGRVSMATLPPSVLSTLDPGANGSLTTLVTAGEACPRWLVEDWGHGRRLVNAYGPTEGTVCATTARLWPGDEIVIGQPIANVSVHLLDEQQRPVARGAVGEIYLGGAGVARGYVGAPEATAERFVPAAEPDERLYRTGDLARMRPDGAVVFLGRSDAQVKLHGVRIELGEVESIVVGHPEVVAAAALVAGDKLVCFVVPTVPAGLRDWALARLPVALVPGIVLPLAAIPTMVSGKVDRAALAHTLTCRLGTDRHTAPRSPLEARLAAVWAEVLGLPEVGVDENFYDLGGTSLHAARIMTRCRLEGDLASPLLTGSVAAQAAHAVSAAPAGSADADRTASTSIPIRPRRGRRP